MTTKGDRVCVMGRSSFIRSWVIMRLLRHGYSVNTIVRLDPEGNNKDVSFPTSLPGAAKNLPVMVADLSDPGSFDPAIKDGVGVFHVATLVDF